MGSATSSKGSSKGKQPQNSDLALAGTTFSQEFKDVVVLTELKPNLVVNQEFPKFWSRLAMEEDSTSTPYEKSINNERPKKQQEIVFTKKSHPQAHPVQQMNTSIEEETNRTHKLITLVLGIFCVKFIQPQNQQWLQEELRKVSFQQESSGVYSSLREAFRMMNYTDLKLPNLERESLNLRDCSVKRVHFSSQNSMQHRRNYQAFL